MAEKRPAEQSGTAKRHAVEQGPPAPELLPLERENAHPRDARIVFHDRIQWQGKFYSHTYWIDGSCEGVKSVTAFTHYGFRPFDAQKKVEEMMSTSVLNPKSDYYGKSREQILAEWAAAGPDGTYMHRQIELFENGLSCDTQCREMQLFLNFKHDFPELRIWRTEMNLFCKELRIAGQADAIYRNAEGQYEIYDWKRTRGIYRNGFCGCPGRGGSKQHRLEDGQRCSAFGTLELTRDMEDCNYVHYTIQLNIYRWLLKRFYGITAVRMVLVVLHPKQENYIRLELPNIEDYVVKLMKLRQEELRAFT
jgi:hypothetical protein